jgi:hypothetical protein
MERQTNQLKANHNVEYYQKDHQTKYRFAEPVTETWRRVESLPSD